MSVLRYLVAASLTVCTVHTVQAAEPTIERDHLIVHEWGTFTEFHDLAGRSIGGINTDDEPVPDFVHKIGSSLLEPTVEPWRQHRSAFLGKALRRLENVRMRLETPVIYFYPPPNLTEPLNVTVDVQFRGGWLSEFYPAATDNSPGLGLRRLDRNAVGSLQWSGLEVGALGDDAKSLIPETNDHVWLAPRQTESSLVRIVNAETGQHEAENYLFYRGVGNFPGPLQVTTDLVNDQIEIHSRMYTVGADKPLNVPAAWLVSINEEGELAFRAIDGFAAAHDRAETIGRINRRFSPSDFSPGNLPELTAEMHAALLDDGLYADEATAMLSTWRDAYFASPGLRLFYIVPREWTDDRMPLSINHSAEIERVMMGRIELVSDRQLELIHQLKSQPSVDAGWFKHIPSSEARNRFSKGENNLDELASLGVAVPDAYRAYVDMGRFRNALLRHEAMQTGDPQLLSFLRQTGLMTQELLREYPENKEKTEEPEPADVASAE